MRKMTMSNAGGHVCSGEPIRQTLELSEENNGGPPVVLKAVYYAEPDSSDDAILAEIVGHGGENAFSSKCLCCNRREIAAVFGDQAKALEAGEVLKANWDAEVEILPFGQVRGDHASQKNPICAEHPNVVESQINKRPCNGHVFRLLIWVTCFETTIRHTNAKGRYECVVLSKRDLDGRRTRPRLHNCLASPS